MCTVTIAILPGRDRAIRIACNRDELRTRPAALAPRIQQIDERLAAFPVDPISNGTWIAVNDAGLALVLLNRNPRRRYARAPRSRGNIIPSLIHVTDPIAASALAAFALHAGNYDPFHLIAVDRNGIAEMTSDGSDFEFSHGDLNEPALFTSSSLGDHVVTPPRRKLFQSVCAHGDLSRQRQDNFHRHYWPDLRELSVNMSREDARTISFTSIELLPDRTAMTYLPNGPASHAGASYLALCVNEPVAV